MLHAVDRPVEGVAVPFARLRTRPAALCGVDGEGRGVIVAGHEGLHVAEVDLEVGCAETADETRGTGAVRADEVEVHVRELSGVELPAATPAAQGLARVAVIVEKFPLAERWPVQALQSLREEVGLADAEVRSADGEAAEGEQRTVSHRDTDGYGLGADQHRHRSLHNLRAGCP